MKKIFAVIVLALVMVWVVGIQQADAGTIDFFAHDTATISTGTVSSCNPDGQVTIELSQMSFYSFGLDYSLDGWNTFTSLVAPGAAITNTSFTLTTLSGVTFPQLISFRLVDNLIPSIFYYEGDMEFFGQAHCDPSLFTKITVDWGSLGTMNIVNTCEGVSPVPIPGAVWLLGSGLLGLIGVRRKKA